MYQPNPLFDNSHNQENPFGCTTPLSYYPKRHLPSIEEEEVVVLNKLSILKDVVRNSSLPIDDWVNNSTYLKERLKYTTSSALRQDYEFCILLYMDEQLGARSLDSKRDPISPMKSASRFKLVLRMVKNPNLSREEVTNCTLVKELLEYREQWELCRDYDYCLFWLNSESVGDIQTERSCTCQCHMNEEINE